MDDESTEDEGPDPIQPTMTKLVDDCACLWCPEGQSNKPTVALNGYGPVSMETEICEEHLKRALALFSREPPN